MKKIDRQYLYKNLGVLIHKTRCKQNVTQKNLSGNASIHVNTLMRIEKGDTLAIPFHNIMEICRHLNIDIQKFYRHGGQLPKELESGI